MESIIKLLFYLVGLIISVYIYDESIKSGVEKIKHLNKPDYENLLEFIENLSFFKSSTFIFIWFLIIHNI